MSTNNHSQIEYILRRALADTNFELVSTHRWIWERDRWNELIFALLTRSTTLPEIQVREIISHMSYLDLIDSKALAGLFQDDGNLNQELPHGQRVREFLIDSGFKPQEAQNALIALCELALGIENCFEGKVQLYLRRYGELMLKELNQYFHFSTLSKEDVGFAWTYWLQNALNMPLSLLDDHVKKLCQDLNIELRDLVTVTDDIDLNLAFMDDVIGDYVIQREVAKTRIKSMQEAGQTS